MLFGPRTRSILTTLSSFFHQFCNNSSCSVSLFFQTRYCTTHQQRCGLTHMSPRATTASPPLTPGSRSTTIPLVWHLPLLAPTLWGQMGTTGRQRLTSCRSNSSSSSVSSSRVNCSNCSRSNRSSTTSNSSSCSISNSR